MAMKEATVYIVDLGSSMAEVGSGREDNNLNFALEYVWDKITATVATGRKTTYVGVLGLRTMQTENELEDDPDYANISVLMDLQQCELPQLRKLKRDLVVSDSAAGDAMSALVVGIQMISKHCKKLKYLRRIVLVTDAKGPMQTDDIGAITSKLQDEGIELTVLGIDFDDAEYGVKEESKDTLKAGNEEALKALCTDCGGNFGTLSQAVSELGIPRVKSVKPIPSYKSYLTLGNPHDYDTAFSIDVERYPKTMVAAPPSSSKFVIRKDLASEEATQATMSNGESSGNNDGLTSVQTARTYQIEDENAPGGKRDVDRDELAKGYEYGRTAVHISESDQNVTMFEAKQGLDIVGFVDSKLYERYLDMSRSNVIISQRTNDKASMALSSLIWALAETNSYAVARIVPKENKDPKILLLAPSIEPEFECLYDFELPFAEDVRSYRFPPLDRVVTVSGKHIEVHRNLPNDDLMTAMSDYVDKMDLTTFGKDDEGQATEYAPMEDTYSIMLHRLNQVIKHRAVHPDDEPPPPYEILTQYSQPPSELLEQARPALDALAAAADVKKVPPKAKGKRYGRKAEAPKPLSDLDVNALLASDPRRKQKRIDARNAIPEFKDILANAEAMEEVQDACQQLGRIVCDLVEKSVGDSGYGRAVEALRVMREEAGEQEEPGLYNEFLRGFKVKVLGGELGGERREMWWKVRQNRLSLISKKESEQSAVSEEESKAFLNMKPAATTE
ncbi:hypothetical protein MBLNU230_g6560t1 [Neophaeotheca triangularis]